MIDKGFKKPEIYHSAHQLAIDVHAMTMGLPKHELYEQGSQVRRSFKSVAAQIVEGYCLHKNDFLLYVNRAYASAEETNEHLDLLFATGSLREETGYKRLRDAYELLCKKLFKFIQSVLESHETPFYMKEDEPTYTIDNRRP